MTRNTKIGIGAGVIIILAIGAWAMGLFGTMPGGPTSQDATTTPQQAGAQSDLPSASNDASDQAIEQDTAALDGQIGALSSDSAGVDQSINDKPVTQEY